MEKINFLDVSLKNFPIVQIQITKPTKVVEIQMKLVLRNSVISSGVILSGILSLNLRILKLTEISQYSASLRESTVLLYSDFDRFISLNQSYGPNLLNNFPIWFAVGSFEVPLVQQIQTESMDTVEFSVLIGILKTISGLISKYSTSKMILFFVTDVV